MLRILLILILSAQAYGKPKLVNLFYCQITDEAVDMIKFYEGFRARPYQDGPNMSIGYGYNSPKVKKDWYWTEEHASAELIRIIEDKYCVGVYNLLVKYDAINLVNDNKFSALVSLAYNIGLQGLDNSGIIKLIKAKDFKKAADKFYIFNKAGGKKLPGLVKRRAAERQLFLKPQD